MSRTRTYYCVQTQNLLHLDRRVQKKECIIFLRKDFLKNPVGANFEEMWWKGRSFKGQSEGDSSPGFIPPALNRIDRRLMRRHLRDMQAMRCIWTRVFNMYSFYALSYSLFMGHFVNCLQNNYKSYCVGYRFLRCSVMLLMIRYMYVFINLSILSYSKVHWGLLTIR